MCWQKAVLKINNRVAFVWALYTIEVTGFFAEPKIRITRTQSDTLTRGASGLCSIYSEMRCKLINCK